MISDISIYKETKRNDMCPCGSGKVFKKCCMKEYREIRRSMANAKVSSYTPLQPLNQSEKDEFTEFYTQLLLFSHQYETKSDVIYIEDESESVSQFLSRQRPYFYKNRNNIIKKYIKKKKPTREQMKILKALQDAKFDHFFLLSASEHSAALMDTSGELYNVQALHSPLNEVFRTSSKYLSFRTALIPYKDRYITDGIYNGTDAITKEIEEYLDTVAISNPKIHFSPKDNIINLPLVFTFVIASNIHRFKKMENIVLEKIPLSFAEGMIGLVDDNASIRKNIISSFLRATDLSAELNNEKGEEILSYIIGGTPVLNFEYGTQTDVIPHSILKKIYRQKPIEQSISWESYKKYKETSGRFIKSNRAYSSFYTMLGIVQIEEDKVDDFEAYLQVFNSKEKREALTVGLENLFEELSDKAGFEMHSIFLGVGTNLDSIHEEIALYRKYLATQPAMEYEQLRRYSFDKGMG